MDRNDIFMTFLLILGIVLGPLGFFVMVVLMFTRYYLIAFAYFWWITYDRTSHQRIKRRSEWFRQLKVWKLLRDYYPIKLIAMTELDPTKNYVFGLHPHGVAVQAALCFCTDATGFSKKFPGIMPHLLVHNWLFTYPLREIIIRLGFSSVDEGNFDFLLKYKKGGNAVVLVPGGVREMIATSPGDTASLVLKNRKGFVRKALTHGASLVPVFLFGETDLFDHPTVDPKSLFAKVQRLSKSLLDFPLMYVSGRHRTWLPYRKPLFTVVGSPIHCEKNSDPTKEEVDELHQQYVDELMRVFEKYKAECGHPNQTLELI